MADKKKKKPKKDDVALVIDDSHLKGDRPEFEEAFRMARQNRHLRRIGLSEKSPEDS